MVPSSFNMREWPRIWVVKPLVVASNGGGGLGQCWTANTAAKAYDGEDVRCCRAQVRLCITCAAEREDIDEYRLIGGHRTSSSSRLICKVANEAGRKRRLFESS